MRDLSNRLRKVTLLEQEYYLAISNNIIDGLEEILGDLSKLPKKFNPTFAQCKEIFYIMFEEGTKLHNFITKQKEPLVDREEVEILLGYANEEEMEEVNKAINELMTSFYGEQKQK